MSDDTHYFEKRAAEELAAAESAASPAAAQAHRELADRYLLRIDQSPAAHEAGTAGGGAHLGS